VTVRTEEFQKQWPIEPTGDQPQAIQQLSAGIAAGVRDQVLLGVTGSGKTFTIANVIAEVQRPTLVIAHNKTLAAQLFQEFKELFPNNAVEYFISYYDYYQPEAYVPSTDTFIDKEATINEDIDKMRHSATRALLERRDVIVVASVSCIYGLGSPKAYLENMVVAEQGMNIGRDDFLRQLIAMQYSRNDLSLERGKFRVRGDVVEIVPSHERDRAIRIQFFGSQIEKISITDALKGTTLETVRRIAIYPGTHYVTSKGDIDRIVESIARDLDLAVQDFTSKNQLVEAQRISQRTMHDIDMLREVGYCQGIENYSRYLDGRAAGEPPSTLIDFFPKDFLLVIDESHVSVPQIGGMYRGDRARKETLVRYGFRLPAALDNRPLNFEEFRKRTNTTIFVSATPAKFEIDNAGQHIAEQVLRPTGLVDPAIEVRPATNQVDELLGEIRKTAASGGRTLVTTLTKRMAEQLTEYYKDLGVKIRYLHSDIESIERVEILRELRRGTFDVLIGINLLREGLDLPEVQLVAILDADKEGFLRSRSSLIQTVGRAARNAEGRVILFADKITESMRACLDETERRRKKQIEHNEANGITPQTIMKKIPDRIKDLYNLDFADNYFDKLANSAEKARGLGNGKMRPEKIKKEIEKLTSKMKKAAQKLEFEEAAELRDEVSRLKEILMDVMAAQE
jgi:excinuclease ABC subunit B